jgi:2-C-methyl-D-erythritol 4-phosphate cytidylyltransferase
MKKYAVIVAGGSGQRMGGEVPKQFLLLNGKSVLHYTLQAFLQTYSDLKVILVLPHAHIDKGREITNELNRQDRVEITAGGDTRFQSVKNGLQLVNEPSIIFVHDGVRCLVTNDLIRRCYEQAMTRGSAVPAIAPTDSLRIYDGTEHHVLDRSNVRIIQTPQTFNSSILLSSFSQPYQPSFTDEATVVETAGNKVYLIEGEFSNLKITRSIDLWIAEKLLKEKAIKETTE